MGMKPTTNTCDGPIENLIGTAYDVVKNVYDNIPLLQSLDETITVGGPAIIAAADLALSSSNIAVNAANESEINATVAATKANEASTSAMAAFTSETNAAASELNASNSAAEALANKEISDTKAAEAIAAKDAAVLAQGNAEISALAAASSEANALASKNAAALSETNAANSETAAGLSATTASNAATQALDSSVIAVAAKDAAVISETNAATSESNAQASAIAAAISETNAATSAASAIDSKNQAILSAGNAAASEASALASYQAFQGQYYGASAVEPTTDPLGNPMGEGDLYFDSTSKSLKLYNGSNWQLASTTIEGIYVVDEYTNVAGQTTFNITYDVGLLQVLYNGVQLSLSDFVASNSTSVVLNTPVANADDVITLVRWGAVTESSVVKETPNGLSVVKRTATGAGRFANAVNSDEAVVLGQIGNAAQGTVTTSVNDTTTGRILKVGDFGIGTATQYTLGNDSGIVLGADRGGGASLRYASSGNLEITPRDTYNTIFTRGAVSVGTVANTPESGQGNLNVYGPGSSPASRTGTVRLESNSPMGANVGPAIAFSARVDGAGSRSYTFAKVAGYKETATGGDGRGYLSLATTTLAGDSVEWVRLNSSGKLLSAGGGAFFGSVNSVGLGAIMESGSNANGVYVRYADGTQVCYGALTSVAGTQTWNFPAAFVTGTVIVQGCSAGGASNAFFVAASPAGVSSVTVGLIRSDNATFAGAGIFLGLTAIGRWY